MADTKLSALAAVTTPVPATDLMYLVQSTTSYQVTPNNLLKKWQPDGCRVYNTASQTIPTDTATAITFDSEVYDNGGLHSTVTNTNRITIVTPGTYLITAHIEFASNATNSRFLYLHVNGTTTIANPSVSGASGQLGAAALYRFVATDWVQILVYHDSGGNLDVINNGTAGRSPGFAVQWVGA